jgi:transglutaminase-like putative cysteine protease
VTSPAGGGRTADGTAVGRLADGTAVGRTADGTAARSGGRLSWVEDGHGVAASPLTWIWGVGSCALAVSGGIEEPLGAAGAALVLVVGAAVGRLGRLDRLFRTTGSWMWAIGGGTLAFLAGAWLPPDAAVGDATRGPHLSVATAGLALSLFALPLDWRSLPRLRASVGAGVVFAALAVVGPVAPRAALYLLWAPLAAATLLLMERDVRRAGRQAARHRPPGHTPAAARAADGSAPGAAGASAWWAQARPARTARDAIGLGAVAVVAVVAALVLLPPAAPAPTPGRSGRGGEQDPAYAGFGADLDTAGRAALGDDVVLRVRADTPALWRGDSYDRFDGRTWTHGDDVAQPLPGTDRLTVPGPPSPRPAGAAAAAGGVSTEEQVQVFTFERGGNDLVFGANRPRVVLTPGLPATWFAEADAIRLDHPLGRGGSYTVISARPRVTEEVLRSLDGPQAEAVRAGARPRRGDPPPAPGRPGPTVRRGGGPPDVDPFGRYLAVPVSTSERTRALAAEVTAGAATTVDRVRALEAWLGANTRYRLDIPPLPPGRDTVDQYLFEDRQGYCEQIASALAVMLRTLGVPARLAVGFVPDHQDPTSGEWIVRERNAHAWVEVWWPGVGWQGFDPTAEVPLAPRDGTSGVGDRLGAVAPGGLSAMALVVLAGAAVVAGPRLARRRAPRTWVDDAVTRLDRAGARAGRPRRSSETLLESVEALDRSVLAGAGAPAAGRALSTSAFAEVDGPTERRVRADAERALATLERSARRMTRARRRDRWRRRAGRRAPAADGPAPGAPAPARPSASDGPPDEPTPATVSRGGSG